MHTAQHIVKNVLAGDLAKDRTIILVTHHITLCLPIASYLVELGNGRVIRQGSSDELRKQNLLQKVVEDEDVVDQTDSEEKTELDDIPDLVPGDEVQKKKPVNGKLIEKEARAEGRVAFRTYWRYIKAAGVIWWILIIALMVFLRVITIGNQVRREIWYPLDYPFTPLSSFILRSGAKHMKTLKRPQYPSFSGICQIPMSM